MQARTKGILLKVGFEFNRQIKRIRWHIYTNVDRKLIKGGGLVFTCNSFKQRNSIHFVPLGDPFSPLFKLYIKNNYNWLTFHWGSSPSLALVVIQLRIQHSSACCLTYSQRRRPLNLIHCSVTPCQKKFKTYSNLWPKPTINQL